MLVRSKLFEPAQFQSIFAGLVVFAVYTALALAMFSYGVTPASAQSNNMENGKPPSSAPHEKAGTAADVARGKYLVEGVAVCGQCHTPRDSNGNLDRSHWLQGGSVPYMPAKANSDWPISAPRIGGTPPASDADMIKLLTTGIWTNGNRLRLPMPQFRMERGDAEAVVAYLKTVKAQQ